MSDYVGPDQGPHTGSSTVQTAGHEAAEVKDTAASAAKDVAGTAKDEAASVAGEAKDQARDLYQRTKQELGDQAAKQQGRLASGLGAVGDQFGSMAQGADSGIASDLAQRASDRLGAAASWLKDRDPASVLDEVKAYARRRPLVFIAGAALTGIVLGRLTRALASSASDSSKPRATTGPTYGEDSTRQAGGDGSSGDAPGVVSTEGGIGDVAAGSAAAPAFDAPAGDVYAADDGMVDDTQVVAGDVIIIDDSGDTPLYETVSGFDDRREDADDRRDTV